MYLKDLIKRLQEIEADFVAKNQKDPVIFDLNDSGIEICSAITKSGPGLQMADPTHKSYHTGLEGML